MSKGKENNVRASGKDALLTLSEKINSKMMQPVRVTHTSPVVCILKLGKGKDKEKVFRPYQTQTILLKDLLEVANNTRLFTGVDGKGKNASLYIEDPDVRAYLGFDTLNDEGEVIAEQVVLTTEEILNILSQKNKKAFEAAIEEFKGNISRIKLLEDVIVKNNYNDAQRIKYIEKVLNIDISFDKK